MPTDGRAARAPQSEDDQPLAELRAILLGPDRDAWMKLRERLENPHQRAEDVASVLAEAVRLRSDFRRALQPILEETLQLSVQRNPRMLADALFPIFGQAIRKAITAELDGMLESLSQTLEQRVSLRSLKWRWEAIRTRRPYAEIVLLRSLLYYVEQVFLIHRKTGLMLQHVAAPSIDAKDPEMVSGMLTAIQDFVRDSVSGAEGENLDTVRMGEVSMVLAYGPDVILAGFARGVIPRSLSRVFQDTLDTIEQQMAGELREFGGETSPFDTCRPQLEACLLGQGKAEEARKGGSFTARALLFGIPVLVVMALVGWGVYAYLAERKWSDFEQRLGNEPGIVLTETQRRGGVHQIAGLRDPLAADPVALLQSSGLDSRKAALHFVNYNSLEPRFAGQRKFTELKEQLERRAFRFKTGSAEVPAEQRFLLEDVAAQVLALIQSGSALGKTVRVEVRGNHDPVGTEELNTTLAQGRAQAVQNAFVTMGVPADRVRTVSYGSEFPFDPAHEDKAWIQNRRAHFMLTARSK